MASEKRRSRRRRRRRRKDLFAFPLPASMTRRPPPVHPFLFPTAVLGPARRHPARLLPAAAPSTPPPIHLPLLHKSAPASPLPNLLRPSISPLFPPRTVTLLLVTRLSLLETPASKRSKDGRATRILLSPVVLDHVRLLPLATLLPSPCTTTTTAGPGRLPVDLLIPLPPPAGREQTTAPAALPPFPPRTATLPVPATVKESVGETRTVLPLPSGGGATPLLLFLAVGRLPLTARTRRTRLLEAVLSLRAWAGRFHRGRRSGRVDGRRGEEEEGKGAGEDGGRLLKGLFLCPPLSVHTVVCRPGAVV